MRRGDAQLFLDSRAIFCAGNAAARWRAKRGGECAGGGEEEEEEHIFSHSTYGRRDGGETNILKRIVSVLTEETSIEDRKEKLRVWERATRIA